jgi:hypothetical protein
VEERRRGRGRLETRLLARFQSDPIALRASERAPIEPASWFLRRPRRLLGSLCTAQSTRLRTNSRAIRSVPFKLSQSLMQAPGRKIDLPGKANSGQQLPVSRLSNENCCNNRQTPCRNRHPQRTAAEALDWSIPQRAYLTPSRLGGRRRRWSATCRPGSAALEEDSRAVSQAESDGDSGLLARRHGVRRAASEGLLPQRGVLCGLVGLGHLAVCGTSQSLRMRRFWVGLPLYLMVVLLWFGLVELSYPSPDFQVYEEPVLRVAVDEHREAFHWYLPWVLAGFVPWRLLLLAAVPAIHRRTEEDSPAGTAARFAVIWVAVVLVVSGIPRGTGCNLTIRGLLL